MPSQSRHIQLPSVDRVLQSKRFVELARQYGRDSVVGELRNQLEQTRKRLLAEDQLNEQTPATSNEAGTDESILEILHNDVLASLIREFTPSLRKVFNLTGTILHTNLGRAPYPQTAIDAMVKVSQGACNLEFDLQTGQRGRRDDHVERWICKLTGAEAATTVNNNAAAVLLTLNSIADGKNVIVSRGELIEIGGSFRVPAIMKKAGCKLRETGTTNRTHLNDYKDAIGKKTAALMKVHTSNYEINGFTKSIAASELAELAKAYNIALIDDLGSGTLVDLTAFGLPYERTAREALQDGADVITFSGDKLLGGPQCGIIAGRRNLIELIDKNPMKRAMRLDKVTLAALEAVLTLYASPNHLAEQIPSLRLLSRTDDEIKHTANALKQALATALPDFAISISASKSQIGSGALPTKTLDSYAVAIEGNSAMSASALATLFRTLSIPLIGRISQNALWLDCRSLQHDLGELTNMLQRELAAPQQ